jgi:hypothetical protein
MERFSRGGFQPAHFVVFVRLARRRRYKESARGGSPNELEALETRRQRFFTQECNVVESGRERVPSRARTGFRAHNVRLGLHSYGATAEWPVHQADFDLNRGPRLNPLRAKKEDTARTDVDGPQRLTHVLALSGDPPQVQRKAQLGSSVRPAFFSRADGMGGNTRDAFWLGAGSPGRRVDHRGGRAGRQFFYRGSAAADIRFVHKLWNSSCAHRSPLTALAAGTARRDYPPRNLIASI